MLRKQNCCTNRLLQVIVDADVAVVAAVAGVGVTAETEATLMTGSLGRPRIATVAVTAVTTAIATTSRLTRTRRVPLPTSAPARTTLPMASLPLRRWTPRPNLRSRLTPLLSRLTSDSHAMRRCTNFSNPD